MENNKKETIYLEGLADAMFTLLEQFGLSESSEEFFSRLGRNEEPSGKKLLRAAENFVLSERKENLVSLLKQELKVAPQNIDDLARAVEARIVPLIKIASPEEIAKMEEEEKIKEEPLVADEIGAPIGLEDIEEEIEKEPILESPIKPPPVVKPLPEIEEKEEEPMRRPEKKSNDSYREPV